MGTKRMRPRVQPFMTFHPRRTNSMRMRVRERVIRRTSCMKTPREKLMRGEEVTSRKTHTRTPTNSQLQGEGTLRTTPMRIPMRLPREVVEVASLPSPSTTTRPRLTTRSASTPMTSYPISRWLTMTGGPGCCEVCGGCSRLTLYSFLTPPFHHQRWTPPHQSRTSMTQCTRRKTLTIQWEIKRTIKHLRDRMYVRGDLIQCIMRKISTYMVDSMG